MESSRVLSGNRVIFAAFQRIFSLFRCEEKLSKQFPKAALCRIRQTAFLSES